MNAWCSLCRHARELRARLDQTAQVRAQLVSAVEALQRTARQEDADAVKQAIEAGQACGGGLLDDVATAQQALQRWQLAADSEAKLAKALSDGTSVMSLSRAVQVYCACAHGAQAHDAHRQHAAWMLRQKPYSWIVTAWRYADSLSVLYIKPEVVFSCLAGCAAGSRSCISCQAQSSK